MQRKTLSPIIMAALMTAALVLPSTAFAHGGKTQLPPGLGQPYPSSSSIIVSKPRSEIASPLALCDTMWWYAYTSVYTNSGQLTGASNSQSRDINNHSYPCDIATIGVRNRLWWNNTEVGDTGMLSNSNNSDASAYNNFASASCGSGLAYSRGNHDFEQPGIATYQPTSDASC
ncbi:MAG: hypothetical protein ACR2PL_01460 [Dehalococcoidia bacterium]